MQADKETLQLTVTVLESDLTYKVYKRRGELLERMSGGSAKMFWGLKQVLSSLVCRCLACENDRMWKGRSIRSCLSPTSNCSKYARRVRLSVQAFKPHGPSGKEQYLCL